MSIVWVSELLFGAALGLDFALGAAAPLVCTKHCVSYKAMFCHDLKAETHI